MLFSNQRRLAQGEDHLFLCNIVMEYCDGGDLAAYISNATAAIPEDTISQVLFGPLLKVRLRLGSCVSPADW